VGHLAAEAPDAGAAAESRDLAVAPAAAQVYPAQEPQESFEPELLGQAVPQRQVAPVAPVEPDLRHDASSADVMDRTPRADAKAMGEKPQRRASVLRAR